MSPQTTSAYSKILLPLLLGLLIALHVLTLERYPAPFVDEGWLGSRAWSYKQTHMPVGPLDRGVFDRFPEFWTYYPWLPTWLQSIFYSNSKTPELLPIRFLSLLSGLALLCAIYSIGKRIGGSRTAWLSVFLLLLSGPFLYSAHLARFDILVAAFGFGGVALALKTGPSVWPHLLAGLAVGAAFESHPNGSLYGPVVLALYVTMNSTFSKVFKDRRMWAYVGGVLIGLSIYAALHIVRYPETWMAINRIAGGATHVPPIADPSLLFQSFQKFLKLAWYSSPYMLPLVIPAIAFFFIRRTQENNIALVILLGILLMHILLIQHKILYYVILFSPAIDLAVAHFFFQIKNIPVKSAVSKVVLTSLVVLLLFCSAVYNLLPLRWDWNEDFRKVQSQLKQYVKPGESIMGNQLWWLALPDHQWISWEGLYYYRRYKENASLKEAFLEFQPRLFILDLHVETFIRKTPGTSYAAQMGIPAEEFRKIIQEHGHLRARFDGGYYGTIHIIELDW